MRLSTLPPLPLPLLLALLPLLYRYKAEKLQLDGRLFWHPRTATQLPELENDGGWTCFLRHYAAQQDALTQ